ncbi:MAG: hypothetical protein GXN92_00925 [Candidatus Micrarchaeota archaeon]|nr:hypothetical protein [Candidatus Micrarchaeota archaeon]
MLWLLLLGVVYGAVSLDYIIVYYYLNKEGIVQVEETYGLTLTEGDIARYLDNFQNNDFASWAAFINDSDFSIHVNTRYVEIEDFKIFPQPVVVYKKNPPTGRAEIIVKYNAINRDPDTGIFRYYQVKPRLYRYVLIPEALSFPRSQGFIILDNRTTLLIDYDKQSYRLKELSPNSMFNDSIGWKGTTLPTIHLVLERLVGYDEEIILTFENWATQALELLTKPEGWIIGFYLVLFIYFLLKSRKMVIKHA